MVLGNMDKYSNIHGDDAFCLWWSWCPLLAIVSACFGAYAGALVRVKRASKDGKQKKDLIA
jgi:hypothetical protein